MPELPEAENIGRALNRVLTGRRITAVEVFTPAMREPLLPLLEAGLPGHCFTGVRRRGRYLVAELDDRRGLLMHFGMSGVVRVEDPAIPKRKHEHVFIHLDDGRAFRFECTRRFSILKVCRVPEPGAWPEELAALGVEPLTAAFSGEMFFVASRGRRGCVKNLLMDNRVVVGIGNIYATETLFAAGVDPRREAETLLPEECGRIVREAGRILRRAIELGGSSISDFLNVDGTEGKFAQELRIYGRRGERCPVCGKTIEMVRLGGRSSCYCPGCQR